jgi:holo-[acyl-carrier protein] synthase
MKGIGTDVVSVSRIQRSLARSPGLVESVFTEGERAYCAAQRTPAPHYAARFAAKEAFLKAVGLGLFSGVAMTDIEVQHGRDRAPALALGPTAAAALSRIGGGAPLLSLSHGGDVAQALVVVP